MPSTVDALHVQLMIVGNRLAGRLKDGGAQNTPAAAAAFPGHGHSALSSRSKPRGTPQCHPHFFQKKTKKKADPAPLLCSQQRAPNRLTWTRMPRRRLHCKAAGVQPGRLILTISVGGLGKKPPALGSHPPAVGGQPPAAVPDLPSQNKPQGAPLRATPQSCLRTIPRIPTHNPL